MTRAALQPGARGALRNAWKNVSDAGAFQGSFIALRYLQNNYTLPTLTAYAAAAAAGNRPMHPSVVKFDTAWNGYKYWMAYTPYGGATNPAVYENPSLAVSADGWTWIDHPSVANPVAPGPADQNQGWYNSDTNLFFHDGKLWLNWRHRLAGGSGGEIIKCKTSGDGVTWSETFVLLDNTGNSSGKTILCQSIFRNGSGIFELWGTDTLPGSGQYKMRRWTAPTPTGPWTYQNAATFDRSMGTGDIWHTTTKFYNGKWVMFIGFGPAQGGAGPAWFAESTDALNFKLTPYRFAKWLRRATGLLYKSDFWMDEENGIPVVRFLLGSDGGSGNSISNGLAKFDLVSASAEMTATLPNAVQKLGKYLVGDNFTRADGSSLGVATSGQTWTYPSGSQFSIASNKGVIGGTSNNIALAESGKSNVRVSVRFAARGGDDAGLVFRAKDNYDYWKLAFSGTGKELVLARVSYADNGNVLETTYTTVAWELNNTGVEVLTVDCVGDQIQIFVDGAWCYTLTDSRHSTRTKHGFAGRVAGTQVSGFYVEEIP